MQYIFNISFITTVEILVLYCREQVLSHCCFGSNLLISYHGGNGAQQSGGGGGGGGCQVQKGGRTRVTYFAKEGVLSKTSACPRFVKEGYFFVPRYEVWAWKSPYNPRNRRRVTPEVTGVPCLLPLLQPLNRQRIIKTKVKIRVPIYPMSVFWKKKGCFFLLEKGVFWQKSIQR